jgi:hypothetical protein
VSPRSLQGGHAHLKRQVGFGGEHPLDCWARAAARSLRRKRKPPTDRLCPSGEPNEAMAPRCPDRRMVPAIARERTGLIVSRVVTDYERCMNTNEVLAKERPVRGQDPRAISSRGRPAKRQGAARCQNQLASEFASVCLDISFHRRHSNAVWPSSTDGAPGFGSVPPPRSGRNSAFTRNDLAFSSRALALRQHHTATLPRHAEGIQPPGALRADLTLPHDPPAARPPRPHAHASHGSRALANLGSCASSPMCRRMRSITARSLITAMNFILPPHPRTSTHRRPTRAAAESASPTSSARVSAPPRSPPPLRSPRARPRCPSRRDPRSAQRAPSVRPACAPCAPRVRPA